jgi:uncharacterized protein (TIGR02145 family)
VKHLYLFGLLLSLPFFGFSQGETNIWYFGAWAGLDFNSGTPVALNNSAMWAGRSTISVSDSTGSLLFYSDGLRVFNRHHILMPNSLGMDGNAWQPVFSVKNLQNDSLYFLFTVDYHYNHGFLNYYGLRYSVLNMTIGGGLGDIDPMQKNRKIYGGRNASQALTGTRHKNNKYAWIVSRLRDADSNYFVSYLVNNDGLDTVPVISNSLVSLNDSNPDIKVIKISLDGTKLACCYTTYGQIDSNWIEVCSFNSLTGSVTPRFLITPTQGAYGPYSPESMEFSVDSKYLYVSALGTIMGVKKSIIFQYDANKTDSAQFKQSETIIGISRGSFLQLAPDWKIYGTEFDPSLIDSLCRINNPSMPGAGCNFEVDAVSLNGHYGGKGLPQFLQKYKAFIHHSGNCQEDSVHFYGDIWPPADSIHWDFGDPASGIANFSNLPSTTHIYPNTGTYTVELFVRHNDNRTDTSWMTITIYSNPQPNIGSDQTICSGDSITFDAGACTGCTYLWKDLGSGLTVGTAQTFRTDQAGTYMVTVTNANECNGTDTVQLITTPIPSVTNNPLSKSICSGESTNIPLTSNVSGTTFHWTASLSLGNITGFSADSGLVINQVLSNSLPTPGIVTYQITPKIGSCAGTPVDFQVTVNPGDSVKVTITASTNNICAGTSVIFNSNPTNPGATPFYQWKVNGINSGTNSTIFTYTPLNGDVVTCLLTSSLTSCISNNPALSNPILMVIDSVLIVNVSINSSSNPVCAGISVTFTATPVNGGTTPSYQWKVNGINTGTNSPVYSYVPLNGDQVNCELTSSVACPLTNPITSNTLSMTTNNNLPVSLVIAASANPFCPGSSVTFTATPTNGGTTPAYQWKVNGANAGTNSPNYTYNPANGDMVSCVLTSSVVCPITNPITSNTLLMTINNSLPAGVSISASSNPFCPGSSVTFTATPTNGGGLPLYQWKVNGINVGTNSTTYSYNPADGDSVRCIMTSNLSCVTGNPASSAKIIMSGTLAPIVSFTSCFDTITTVNAKPIKLKGGIPLGGTYSGSGVNSLIGIFDPATAGIGTKTITYTYTNAAMCSALAHTHIINYPLSIVNCGNPITDIRDNKVYPTVQIGSQCWLASNLNFGTTIASTQDQRDNCIAEKYCYNDNPVNCLNHGGLYQWDEVMRFDETPADQGFCPPGWHIPTENDWNILFATYINNGFAGSPLKYSGYSGFNALLSGTRHINKSWNYQGFATFFWSSTPRSDNKAWAHGMNDPDPSVSLYPASRVNAFSVRCLKD